MKEAWKNNLSLKIVSVLFSVILWWAVMNIDDPVDTKSFRTGVQILHPEVITDNGYSYRIDDEMKQKLMNIILLTATIIVQL